MLSYSAILVDDEQAAHHAMQFLLKKYDRIKIIGQAYTGLQAVDALVEYSVVKSK